MSKVKTPKIPNVNPDDIKVLQEDDGDIGVNLSDVDKRSSFMRGFDLGRQHQRLQQEILRISKLIDKRQQQLQSAEDALDDVEAVVQTLESENN